MNLSVKYEIANLYSDRDKIISYINRYVNPLMNLETFKWQYQDIGSGTVFGLAINEKNEIVSTQSFLPYEMIVNDSYKKTGKSENSHLLSEYRGSTIFKDLYEIGLNSCKHEKMCIIWGFTPAAKVWKKKLNFNVYEDIIYDFTGIIGYKYQNDLKLTSNEKLKKFIYYKVNSFVSKLKFSLFYKKQRKINNVQILDKPKKEKDINDLFLKIGKTQIRLNMKDEFLNWRVFNNPNVKYTSKFFYKNESLIGFYIYSLSTNFEAQVVELIGINDDTLRHVTYNLFLSLYENKISKITYFGNIKNEINSKAIKAIRKICNGKLVKNEGMNFVIKYIDDFEDIPVEKIYINGLWTEGYSR
jgi:hypothetical protein